MIGAAAFLAILVSACSPAAIERGQFRGELREQRATAEQLCAERGGVEMFAPIPERMDVLTVFRNAGRYRVVRGPGDPNLGGTTTYQVITHVAREEMAELTQARSVGAYVTAAHYLSTARVKAVDFLLEDFQYHDNEIPGRMLHDGRLLPDRNLPNGIYRYEILPSDDPACGPFNAMVAMFDEQGSQSGYAPQDRFTAAVASDEMCIGISYQGSAETYTPPDYLYHEFNDDLPDQKVRQVIDELIAPDGAVIARLRNFTAGARIGHCPGGRTNILEHFVFD